MEKELSFIIPVYNVEKYLEECVESILCQIDASCEIILIDDGSTDSSGDICDRYAERNENISVIHKENGGLSSARNAGLVIAEGKYIVFVDSDDRIAKGSVKDILNWIADTKADICFMKVIKFYPNGRIDEMGENIQKECVFGISKKEVIKYISTRPKYPGSACSKIYKRTFLKENNLFFPKDKRLSEDLGFVRDCLMLGEKYDVLEMPYYEYRQRREGSITNAFSVKNFNGVGLFVEETAGKLTKNKIPKGEVESYVMGFVAYEYSILLWQYGFLSCQDKKEAFDFLNNWKWVLDYAGNRKIKLISKFVKFFGISFTSMILGVYMKIR